LYNVTAVHHVALGVKDLELMKTFYRDTLGFNKTFIEFPELERPEIVDVMRGVFPVFGATLLYRREGTIIIELVKMTRPKPRAIRHDFKYGDIGANKVSIVVSDVQAIYQELKHKINFCSVPKSVNIPGWGEYNFVFGRDPERNLIEFVSGSRLPAKSKIDGIRWIGISVTDIKRSIPFYQKYAGYDTIFVDVHDGFSGLVDEISAGINTRVLSCILANSKGEGMIELFEMVQPRGRSIPSFTIWGDFGYWQTCHTCDNVTEIADNLARQGLPFFTKLKLMHDEHEGAFIYVQDPDGIPLEFISFGKP
jgi:catechol 2,3-dioxygenase-like lactoylglutathione lyase family enzyme